MNNGVDNFVIIVLFSRSLCVVFSSPKRLLVPECITRLLLSTFIQSDSGDDRKGTYGTKPEGKA